jgi:hypothetical protein
MNKMKIDKTKYSKVQITAEVDLPEGTKVVYWIIGAKAQYPVKESAGHTIEASLSLVPRILSQKKIVRNNT